MEREVIIASPHVQLNAADQSLIRDQVEKLERKFPRLVGCRVSVEPPPAHSGGGASFRVGVELRVPASEPLVAHEDDQALAGAIRGAFSTAQRRLDDFAQRLRGDVKSHA